MPIKQAVKSSSTLTMSDIAEQAGVSRPTVSVVLNQRHDAIGIAEETRLKVLRVAEEMGYRRNELARAVKTGKSHTIGFLAGTTEMEYTARFFSGAIDAAEEGEFSMQRFRIGGDERDRRSIVRCVEHRLAGVIIYDPDNRLPMDMVRREFEAHDLSTVLLDVKTKLSWGRGVASDDELGAAQSVQHLAELGHRRIVLIGGIQNVGTAIPRLAGYRKAMRECGLNRYARSVWTDWVYEEAEKRLRELMSEAKLPTALLCGSDALALQMMRTLRELGKNVPHDVSVIGFGNLLRTDFADPALTTIEVPYEQMGRKAVELLLEPNPADQSRTANGSQIYLPTRLVVRNSTAPPTP